MSASLEHSTRFVSRCPMLQDLGKSALSGRINQAIHKDKAVVVNTVDITEIKRKVSLRTLKESIHQVLQCSTTTFTAESSLQTYPAQGFYPLVHHNKHSSCHLRPPQTAYCRCWKSSKFPFCDGTHKKHNQETGDNVGPLIMERPGA